MNIIIIVVIIYGTVCFNVICLVTLHVLYEN
jgi:hypothetical protein